MSERYKKRKRVRDLLERFREDLLELEDADTELDQVRAERDRYRQALVLIGNGDPGHWGAVAQEALYSLATRTEER